MWPVLTTPTAAFAAVGMGALFVGVVRAPVTGIALIVEDDRRNGAVHPVADRVRRRGRGTLTALGDRAIYDALRLREAARSGRSGQ